MMEEFPVGFGIFAFFAASLPPLMLLRLPGVVLLFLIASGVVLLVVQGIIGKRAFPAGPLGAASLAVGLGASFLVWLTG